jgi:type I restriction enzyme S subunit
VKAGWELKKLGDVCALQNGFAFKSKLFKPSGVPVLRISSIQNDSICDNRPVFVDPSDYKENLDKYKVVDDDLLIAMSGATTGKVGFNQTGLTFLLNQRVGKFEPSEHLEKRYLYFYLSTKVQENLEISAGAAQPNLSTHQIKEFQIPLPPLEEQKRIVSILDEAFEGLDRARENAEANLKSARELFESSLGAVFDHASDGWTKGTVGSMIHDGILERPLDGNHGETHPKKSEFQSSGVPFIMASDLVNGSVDQNNCYFISKSQAETLRKGFAKDGDVLISHKGTIGRSAVLRTDLDYVMLTPQVTYYRVADQNRLLPEFLYFYFHSATFVRVMKDLASAGSTRAYIGITKQHELPLLLPEITLQLELIDRFKSLEVIRNKAILSYETKLQDISDLRQSLLQKAFAGELT